MLIETRLVNFPELDIRLTIGLVLVAAQASSEQEISVDVERDLFKIEETFWMGGEEEFRAHLAEQCLLAFPQGGEMHGVFGREAVAKTATTPNRWRDLHMTDRIILRVAETVAFISYLAKVRRADGVPYEALIGSTYVHEAAGWKLATHQHSPSDK